MDSGFPFGVPSRLEYTSGRLRFSPGYRRPPRTSPVQAVRGRGTHWDSDGGQKVKVQPRVFGRHTGVLESPRVKRCRGAGRPKPNTLLRSRRLL
jgi:hypothetical protein